MILNENGDAFGDSVLKGMLLTEIPQNGFPAGVPGFMDVAEYDRDFESGSTVRKFVTMGCFLFRLFKQGDITSRLVPVPFVLGVVLKSQYNRDNTYRSPFLY